MPTGTRPVVYLAKWLAAVTALLISIGTPAGYLYFGYQQAKGAIAAESTLIARQISQLINSNPDYWIFESLRIGEMVGRHVHPTGGETHLVTDAAGKIVAQTDSIPAGSLWPTLSRQQPLYDYGVAVGRLDITYSLENLYQRALVVGLLSVLAGLVVYWGLRVLPLRALERAWDRLSYLASHDALTGLPNRVLFLDRLEQAMKRAERKRQVVTVHSIDLDHFKDVNDTLGHAAGDALLRQTADRMKACLRQEDTVARLSGDEFAIIQNDSEKAGVAAGLAQRIIETLSVPFDLSGQQAIVGASVGMAVYAPGNALPADQLLKNADLALYRSKDSGRGTFHFFEERMDEELQRRKALEMDLRRALQEKQLRLQYQPQVDVATQRVVGLEALLRWHHPVRGEVAPSEFIPVAESTGLVFPLSEWILTTACTEALGWAPLRVAVNLTPTQFAHRNLVSIVEKALQESGLPGERLEIEITEDVLISETERTLEVLNALKRLGVHIAMDDFGTGYSSLGYLRRFPFDKIKIDRSFIADLDRSPDARAIVKAIIGLGTALGIQVNAEGVETVEQMQRLMSEGCEQVQGFYYGQPMSKANVEELLTRMGALVAAPGNGFGHAAHGS